MQGSPGLPQIGLKPRRGGGPLQNTMQANWIEVGQKEEHQQEGQAKIRSLFSLWPGFLCQLKQTPELPQIICIAASSRKPLFLWIVRVQRHRQRWLFHTPTESCERIRHFYSHLLSLRSAVAACGQQGSTRRAELPGARPQTRFTRNQHQAAGRALNTSQK